MRVARDDLLQRDVPPQPSVPSRHDEPGRAAPEHLADLVARKDLLERLVVAPRELREALAHEAQHMG